MRNFLLAFISLLSFFSAEAQMSFAPIGTEYNYVTMDWMGLPFLYTSLISEKDTIVNGAVNRKLLKIERDKGSDIKIFPKC